MKGFSVARKNNHTTIRIFINTLNAFHLEFANILSSLFIFFFREIGEAFNLLGKDPDCRVIILSGNGKAFCAGIDLNDLMALGSVVNDIEQL